MRVAPNQFLCHRFSNVCEGKSIGLSGELRVKNNLEKQIAQFIFQIHHVLTFNGVHYFIDFFDGVWNQAVYGLFEIQGQPCSASLNIAMT